MSHIFILPIIALISTALAQNATTSAKRGLIYIKPKTPTDETPFIDATSDLTWYYNYESTPTSSLSSSKLSFIPMLFGADPSSPTSTSFLDTITSQLSSGANITHILSFNEPDGPSSTGGSALSATTASQIWIQNIEPMKQDHGIKLGLPAVTGSPSGLTWLQAFNTSCNGGCNPDFIPIHWYGDFQGLASHLGQVRATYPNLPIWITEFADPNVALAESQAFYNESTEYFDRLDYVERYSYFGVFRSDVSNVGPNVAFLDQKGRLTDIGSWYLGGEATGNKPKGGAGKAETFAGWGAFIVIVGLLGIWS